MLPHLTLAATLFTSVVALSALPASAVGGGAPTPGGDDWKYDVVHRTRGEALKGLVLEESRGAVRIRCISRRPGSPTIVFTENVPRAEVTRVVKLNDADRELLSKRLDSLKREREVLADTLRALAPRGGKAPDRSEADALDLAPVAWPLDRKVKALSYRSAYFTLIARARPELAQLVAIQLEQIYAAYARQRPPRAMKAAPTTILLTGSLADYQAIAKARKLSLFNPAFYDPGQNQVVCGSDLERLCDQRDKVREHHQTLRKTIKERRAELAKVYRNKVPAEVLAPLADAEARVVAVEKKNNATFAAAQDRLFRRLYHEAFHAYVGAFVYPPGEGELSVWLNEGLAQIFETAIVEVGELRVGHADRARLEAVRTAIAKGTLLPLADLLKSQPRNFQVAHAEDKQLSDRYYLASWAAAFYLTFELKLLGTKGLDDHVKALRRGTDPLAAFEALVGKGVVKFEKELHEYLAKLRPDGTRGR